MSGTSAFSRLLIASDVRTVNVFPHHATGTPYFVVWLTCGGPCGEGATVELAIQHARELNADWLPKVAA